MIKVKKNLKCIPYSLLVDTTGLTRYDLMKAKTTHKRRLELINLQDYKDESKYNDRYKTKDIRDALESIYHGKCAYCESNEELLHVEHYRPKKIYYWLAYSWDNLLLACHFCNIQKNNNFSVDWKFRVSFKGSPDKLLLINNLSKIYDQYESPKIINVENFDPYQYLEFYMNGKVRSNNPRVRHTINVCDLNRKKLKDKRRKIIDDIKKEIEISFRETDNEKLSAKLQQVIDAFAVKLDDPERNFLALRHYLIDKKIIVNIIRTMRDKYTENK
ncbi:TIGR02646 family protein [Acinetobacter haemolyticus]|uniref:retron system putative HNH endonuclease n=1 Tax=Acinetobacter haemolyticus TaxID=29430 RepID=UPI0021D088E9|nr:retron system putative HNH endonuclease [Acinetobacter haemolyticus]MCU4389008.1 TIGR02646 family protein [Acinetobacter haemolyticus]